MGGMSASDAAPLPRLGEVFFDVRGDSRSMRLSWYADTGVAVLSIWQGGMCTGTFRLAIADLPRMVETLQRGPRDQRQEWDPEAPGEVFDQVPRVATGQGQAQAEYRIPSGQYQTGQYQTGPYQTARHQAGRHQTAQYLAELPDDPRAGAPPRPPAPPDPLAPPPEYLPAPSDPLTAVQLDQPTGTTGYQAPLPDQRTEYLTDLPGTGPVAQSGYDAGPGSPGTGYPPADAGGPYPAGPGREALADDPYLGGTGPMDYPDPHSPPGPGDPDYPAHYGRAVVDDILPGPVLDSVPHDRPQGRRRAASRHAAPDVPLD